MHHHCIQVLFFTLKVVTIEKGLHHFLETLKGFSFEKWLHHILMTHKVYQNSYSVECWWTAASEGHLSYHIYDHELHLHWVSNFIALGIYFLFGIKFSWYEEAHTCFNVECVLLGRNFDLIGGYLVVTARYLMVTTCYFSLLVVTARYRSLLLVPTFSMNV